MSYVFPFWFSAKYAYAVQSLRPKAIHLTHSVSINITPALLLAKHTTKPYRCTLGNVEGLASTDARSDHAVLELFGYLFLSREKGK